MRYKFRALHGEVEDKIGHPLSYRDIEEATGVSKSAVARIANNSVSSADFDNTARILRYFSDLTGTPYGVSDIIEFSHEPQPHRELQAA